MFRACASAPRPLPKIMFCKNMRGQPAGQEEWELRGSAGHAEPSKGGSLVSVYLQTTSVLLCQQFFCCNWIGTRLMLRTFTKPCYYLIQMVRTLKSCHLACLFPLPDSADSPGHTRNGSCSFSDKYRPVSLAKLSGWWQSNCTAPLREGDFLPDTGFHARQAFR